MKKLLKLSSLFVAIFSVILITGCEEEETPMDGPTFTIGGADAGQSTFNIGDTVDLEIDFSAANELSSVIVTPTVNGQAGSQQIINPSADLGLEDLSSGTFTLSYGINDSFSDGDSVSLAIELLDMEELSTEETFSFSVVSPISAFSAVLLYAPLQDASSETWFSANLGRAVTEAEVNASADPSSSDIDFGYYYGNTDEASLASPSAYPTLGGSIDISDWSTRNTTTFRATTLSSTEFVETSTSAQIDQSFDDGTEDGAVISGLEVGQVVAFELDESKGGLRGLILVTNIRGTFNENDYIEIDILIQE